MDNNSISQNDKLIPLSLVLIALAILYFPYLQTLVTDWNHDDNYSHGYFIPVIFLYMLFSIKDKILATEIQPLNSGILLIGAGLASLLIAKIGSEFFLQRSSFIIVLLGLILFLLGKKHFKLLSLPVLYLIFMIPLPTIIWNKIAFPLQLFGSFITEKVIRILGIVVLREGNILHLSNTTLEVVAACSGLRSLVTMFAMSSLLAWISQLPTGRKWLLFFAAAPTAIFANVIRLTVTAILASYFGGEVAQGFLHDFSGIFTFGVGFVLLMSFSKIIEKSFQ